MPQRSVCNVLHAFENTLRKVVWEVGGLGRLFQCRRVLGIVIVCNSRMAWLNVELLCRYEL